MKTKIKLHLPKPIHAHHAEHTAAVFTILGMVAAYYPPLHILEGVAFGTGGFLAIYANRFGHRVVVVDHTEE